MIFLEQLRNLRFTKRQLVELVFDIHNLLENRFRFQGEIHRITLFAILIQPLFSQIQFASDFRQLLLQKCKTAGILCFLPRNVLLQIVVGNPVKHMRNALRIVSGQRERQHPTLLCRFNDAKLGAERIDSFQTGAVLHRELRARWRIHFYHQQ